MKETTLYVVRHGQTEWNLEKRLQGHQDSPLTQLGKEQASQLCHRLGATHIDMIYCSESKRTRDTANLIKGSRAIPVVIKPEFKELNLGAWEGLQHHQVIAQEPESWDHFWHSPHLYVPNEKGESYQQLKERAIPAVEKIISEQQGKTILIVTHQITTKMIMSYFQQRGIDETFHTAVIAPTSLSKISIQDGIPTVLLHGDTSHYK